MKQFEHELDGRGTHGRHQFNGKRINLGRNAEALKGAILFVTMKRGQGEPAF